MSLYTTMLESVGTLKRPTPGQGTLRGTTSNPFKIIVADVPCSVQPASSSDRLLYGQRNVFITCTIYLVQDIGAMVNDIFEVVDLNENLHVYLVHGFNRGLNKRDLVPYSLSCTEIAPNRPPQSK